jgi:hypothetical protein
VKRQTEEKVGKEHEREDKKNNFFSGFEVSQTVAAHPSRTGTFERG